ncbi:hypothetical protein ES705_13629 [subsurface metagenome]
MPATKDYLLKKYQKNEIDEYLADTLRNAEYGGVEVRRTPLGDRVVLRVGRVGLAIGGRGKNIRRITEVLQDKYQLDNPQIEVTEVENPETDARIMAYRLASSLERGRHFRRSAHGIIRRIVSTGAKGVEIKISGKITSQRARVETFRAGFVAKCGEPASKYVDVGKAQALIRRGLLGVQVEIMRGDAILPDDIEIIAEPTSTSMVVLPEGEQEEETIEITEETLDELEEFPEITDEISETKTTPEDEFKELDEVDDAIKSKKEEIVEVEEDKPKKKVSKKKDTVKKDSEVEKDKPKKKLATKKVSKKKGTDKKDSEVEEDKPKKKVSKKKDTVKKDTDKKDTEK